MASFFLLIDKSNSPNRVDWDLLDQDCSFVDDRSGCCIVSESRIDYRRELAEKLDMKWDVAKDFSDNKLILLAYMRWGEACLSHLYGEFSFVIWDPGKDELLCARDHFGCRPLYYVDQPGRLVLASQISAFKNLPGFSFEIREQYILDSICSIEKTEVLSAFKGINKLKPAHYLEQKHGQLSDQQRYWDLKLNEKYKDISLEKASEKLKEKFIEAVRQKTPKSGQVGVELSGGLDSSGIASVLTKLSGQNVPINAFTQTIPSDGKDQQRPLRSEKKYYSALVEQNGSISQYKITGDDSKGGYHAMVKALDILQKPINLNYAMNSDLLFEVAGNLNTSIIFSGLGGDEGITNDGSGYFNELISQGLHSQLRDEIKNIADCSRNRFYRKLIKSYINYYAPRVINLYKKDWRKAWYRSFALQKSLLRKYRMKPRFFKASSLPGKADVRTVQHFRLMYPNIPERIEETSLLAQQHGIEYRYPFLDVKLLEFFYSLPSEYKYKDGMGRHLFRMAMKDILPDKIRMRTDKGGNTIPNVFARLLKDEEIFREVIEECRLKNHYHYVDYDKLHDMLEYFRNMDKSKTGDYGLRSFQSPMSILILQKWQREGKIDIGIKC